MSETKFYQNMMQLGTGIEACLDRKLITPALVLLYSAIDITSWLASDKPNAIVREYFVTWVEKYLLPSKPLKCTALELYSARCGIVHTLTPDSQLVKQGKARRIAYAWGTAKSSDLSKLIDKTKWSDKIVSVQVEELYGAWRLGLLAFSKELEDNTSKAVMVYERSDKFFSNLDIKPFKCLLDSNDLSE